MIYAMAGDELILRIDLIQPFHARAVRSARRAVLHLAQEWEFAEQACREIELGFGEALQNAVDHGSGDRERISVRCRMTSRAMVIRIEDSGRGGGNLKHLRKAFSDKAQDAPCREGERGRGVFLIRRLMDEATMTCMDHGGVRIEMVKYLT